MAERGKLKVVIAGAGIAGLATAIALRLHPHIEVELYEQATELKEIGASIALSPNVRSALPSPPKPSSADEIEGTSNTGEIGSRKCSH